MSHCLWKTINVLATGSLRSSSEKWRLRRYFGCDFNLKLSDCDMWRCCDFISFIITMHIMFSGSLNSSAHDLCLPCSILILVAYQNWQITQNWHNTIYIGLQIFHFKATSKCCFKLMHTTGVRVYHIISTWIVNLLWHWYIFTLFPRLPVSSLHQNQE